ncbi:short-chain fatty acyl-CoA regulator family protein [Rhodococcus sp. HNM0569]|uniref:short-chain fatty acyl-CoA regulator family protein n=1 Tax=Rhodococcus sp. HNM0569 TaxID=2716340 RepID=UPI00146CCA57|nr:short-chain fatty acyl-CoA regulator family protein [Rhodococcus sp. HNM0569]NLU84594.1 DUF2083 domain-containing protein [Rhodococcus sp. HNM0569]
MQKMFAGGRLRRLRDERALTQTALAKMLGLSVSYVNQLENDQRPLTVPVLLRLNSVFDLDMAFFAADTDARLLADLQEALADHPETADMSAGELDELATRMPAVAHALVAMHRRVVGTTEQLDSFTSGTENSVLALPESATGAAMPYEDVRDFFYDNRNHIPELDDAAEELFDGKGLTIGGLDRQLADLLRADFEIGVTLHADDAGRGPKRRYDARTRTVTLARRLSPGQRAFQLATQLAFVAYEDVLDVVLRRASSLPPQSRELARIGLANYFAGALVLPYGRFLDAAEKLRYDIDLLSGRFEVGFETICHRLSTLQRPGRRGVPFFFVRTDRAGNISKRQSATAFHFSRVGGSCPLWVVHDAFATPGRIRTQIAQMPDGRSYLWLARTTGEEQFGYLAQNREFAVGLGCDLGYASRLVYSTGMNIDDPSAAVPIGAGCKICERPNCAQRAFPQVGRALWIDQNTAGAVPYAPAPDPHDP